MTRAALKHRRAAYEALERLDSARYDLDAALREFQEANEAARKELSWMDSALQQVLREQGVAESDIEREVAEPVDFRGLVKVVPAITREAVGLPPAYSSPGSPAKRVRFYGPDPADAGPSRLRQAPEVVESSAAEPAEEGEGGKKDERVDDTEEEKRGEGEEEDKESGEGEE